MKNLQLEYDVQIRHEQRINYNYVQHQEGFITIITVLLMLVIISIVGISAINISIIENSVVRNDTLYKKNLFLAESAGFEAAQRLENATMNEENPTGGVAWLVSDSTDMADRSSWLTAGGVWTGNSVESETFYTALPVYKPGGNPSNLDILIPQVHTTDDIRLAAQFRGVASGSSLKVTSLSGRLYSFQTFGMYSNMAAAQGESLVEMGYRKRF